MERDLDRVLRRTAESGDRDRDLRECDRFLFLKRRSLDTDASDAPALSLADGFFLATGSFLRPEAERDPAFLASLSDSSSPNDVMNLIPPSNGEDERDLDADAERRYWP